MSAELFTHANDEAMRKRAEQVMPGGVYGHMAAHALPLGYPQFTLDGEGVRFRDLDGNEYIDFMCSWGPVVLGRKNPVVEAAVQRQLGLADTVNGAAPVMVELAELLVDTIPHADWAMLAKNGTDATTTCVTIARAATGRRKVLVARGAYHGSAPWCTPGPAGVTPEDRANLSYFDYNDITSLTAAADQAGTDLAAIVLLPGRHDAHRAQELVVPEFAQAARRLCDQHGAALILDDVRWGFRIDVQGSWEPIGVRPDLSAYSKAIANGYPLAAIAGRESLREAARSVYVTGSFWYSAVPMAAAVATITQLRDTDALTRIQVAGERLRDGLLRQAKAYGLDVAHTGPVQAPLLVFADDPAQEIAGRWTSEAVQRGVYLHPWHNWFLAAAHTDTEIDAALERTEEAFAAVARSR